MTAHASLTSFVRSGSLRSPRFTPSCSTRHPVNGRPLRARGQDRRHRHHVAIRGQSPDDRIRCRPKPSPRHPARRARTPIRRSRHGQASIGPRGSQGDPSFGLLGPGKGYELALAALPDVVAEHPSVVYVVVGATHPDLLRSEGEAYREGLVETVARLGLDHVRSVDR